MGKVVVRGEDARQRVIEILKNGGTWDDAAAETGFGRDYCRQLGARAGIRFTYKYNFDENRLIELYTNGVSAIDAAKELRCPDYAIRDAWKRIGLDPRHKLTELQTKVKRLREQGKCCVEIADELGKNTNDVRHIAIRVGMPFTEEEVQRSIQLGAEKQRRNDHERGGRYDPLVLANRSKKYIEEHHEGWTYIDGRVNSDDYMSLRCETCGEIVKISSVTVRKTKNLTCPVCKEKERSAREQERERERKTKLQEREKKKEELFWSQEFAQISMKKCEYCGGIWIGKGKYCSNACRKKATNRKHDKRIQRAKRIDTTISLEKLYHHDNGICWICGTECDFNDYRVDGLGNFIVGKNYPSIDHVFPLSKGGSHTWDNVKLAHHYCNTLKNDKVVS